MFTSKLDSSKRRGFALTEVLLSIAVIVIIGIVAYPLYENSKQNAQIDTVANAILETSKNMDLMFSNSKDYSVLGHNTGLTVGMDLMASQGLLPDAIKKDPVAGTYNSALGTTMLVEDVPPTQAIAGTKFYVGIRGLPKDACIKIITRLAPAFVGIMGDTMSFLIKAPNSPVDLNMMNHACEPYPTGTHTLWFANN